MSHTPTPWTILKFDDEPTECICSDQGDIRIATLNYLPTMESPDPDNAAHIVHCVNNFNAVIALLKNGLECGVFDGAPEYRADVEQALAAAEKGV